MKILLFLSTLFLLFNFIKNEKTHFLNKSEEEYYDSLFNSIESDYYNFSLIFNYTYNTIKIKHKSNINIYNKISCIFGVLVNENGLKIEKSMLDWLLPEYDVYCIYQKYPGALFEYPALRFAQWLSLNYNKQIILYVHTKGAFTYNWFQNKVRYVWKNEFTKPNNYIYINLLEKNISDISLPFRNDYCTWYNGMFISYRAFKSIKIIPYYNNISRYYYECLTFKEPKNNSYKIRFKGVIFDKISAKDVLTVTDVLVNYVKFHDIIKNNKNIKLRKIVFIMGIIIFIVLLKNIIR